MATYDQKRVSDGALSLEAGCDTGRTPNLIQPNQFAFGINTTVRGGWATCRPGWKKMVLDFSGMDDAQSGFRSGRFQVAGDYVGDDGSGHLISMHGGRQFKIDIAIGNEFTASEITIAGDPNPGNREQAWCCQGENYFVIEDGQTLPFIFNGASSRRATEDEIPVGNQITYYMGRLWVAFGRAYVGGNIVYDTSTGSSSLNFRDSMLKFTEVKFLNEGGAFGVPSQAGDITFMKPIANLNTALGQGELIVGTRNMIFTTLVPQDRETWKNTANPVQRVIQLANGGYAQDSVVNVNEDLFYRRRDGIGSLAFAVRNAGDLGNVPISKELDRILLKDPEYFLKFGSGVEFDNRFLMTATPGVVQNHGIFHRCLTVLDFNLINSMRDKAPPAWEGIWTGLRILKVVKVQHQGNDRCFVYALNGSDQIELWEVTKDADFDEDEKRINWSMELRSMNFGGDKFSRKSLDSADIFIDEVKGEVDIAMQYRPDSHPCWIDWDTYNACSKIEMCKDEFGGCPSLKTYKPQYRTKWQLTQPADDFDPIRREKYRIGYEIQPKVSVVGKARIKQMRFNSKIVEERPYGDQL